MFPEAALGVGKDEASQSIEAGAPDEPCRPEEDRGGAASPVGEGESPGASGEEGRLVGGGRVGMLEVVAAGSTICKIASVYTGSARCAYNAPAARAT
jgi:hypothetical protein